MNDFPQRQLVAAFFDGNAIYLWPDELKELGQAFGYDFASEIEPFAERPPCASKQPLRADDEAASIAKQQSSDSRMTAAAR